MPAPPPIPLPDIDGSTPTIVHLSAEYYPYARTGGLAEAAWGLHRLQHGRGRPTAAIMPLFRTVRKHLRDAVPVGEPMTLHFGTRSESFQLWNDRDPASGTPSYFIQHDGLFDRDGIYGEGGDYPDNHFRFAAFAAAAIAFLPRITSGPVVLHAHDWHAALAPVYLRTWFKGDPWFDRIPVVLSVHNGGYQGHFGSDIIPEIGLPWDVFNHDKLEWHGQTNLLKGGLTHCDIATTVSPKHSTELCTAAGGFGLQEVFSWMGDRFTGVLNGIDQEEWSPLRDEHIAAHYGPGHLTGKAACKTDLQRRFGLTERTDVPVIALAGRLVTQKGLDLVVDNASLFALPAQFVFLGSGERKFESAIKARRDAEPGRIGIDTTFSDELEHQLMAGADLFLMPSQYEPCGLTQMRAQRYGTIPVARRVGGLADTIDDGITGFLFDAYDERALAGGMWRALTEHGASEQWREMQDAGMQRDFGWDRVAETYATIYSRAIARRAGLVGA
ncbi:MAG: glycogen/starch synthase [Gemmatimonadota bacterium]